MTEIYLGIGVGLLLMELFIFQTQEDFGPRMMIVIVWPLFVLWLIMKPFAEREQRRIMAQTEYASGIRWRVRAERNMRAKIEKQKKSVSVVKEVIVIPASTRMEAVIQDLDN